MKKVLLLLTVCVMSLPLRANTHSPEELCNDEIFISFCNENLELARLFKNLDKDDLSGTAEMVCLKGSLTEKAIYLNKTYQLFNNSSETRLVLAQATFIAVESNKIIQKEVLPDCLVDYMLLITLCDQIEDVFDWGNCMAAADAYYMSCMGIP